jgi:hypothetical protein
MQRFIRSLNSLSVIVADSTQAAGALEHRDGRAAGTNGDVRRSA